MQRFFKTDHLVPVITLVVYLGTTEWDGPRTLHDMFETNDPILLSESIDYRLKLIEPYRMTDVDIEKFQTNMREVLLYIRSAKDKQALLHLAEEGSFRSVDPITVHLINEITHSKLKIPKEKEKIDMCEAIQGIREDALNEGKTEGVTLGREQKQREVSLRMAARGMAVSLIAEIVDAAEEVIEGWLLEV